MENSSERAKAFWNARAALKERAGTNDLIAKWLEMRALIDLCHKYLDGRQSRRVLDAGCGNGMTLIALTKEMALEGVGVDFAPEMVKEARASWSRQEEKGRSMLDFQVGDVLEIAPRDFGGKFDLIYTERTLINLPAWKEQTQGFMRVMDCLKKGGRYLMLENSADGLAQINEWRAECGLPEIEEPSHNCYISDAQIERLDEYCKGVKLCELEDVVFHSSTYYFLSRIVNAKMAQNEGAEPEYLSDVNKVAMDLPAELPGFLGQGRMWVWRKA